MVTLREIRNKLHSVENVKKITQAMEMVAGSRLRRVQARTENARPYLQELQLILNNLLASSDDLSHPLTMVRPAKRVGLVVIGADKGLCGSYNNNVIGAVNTFLKGLNSQENAKEHEFFLIGHKMVAYFDKPENTVRRKVVDWGENITFELIDSLTNDLIGSFLSGQLDEVWLVYTHFQNVMTHKALVEKLLPIEIPATTKVTATSNYIFEPSQQQIFAAILPRFVLSKLQLAMNEAFTSELAARILAMRAATKNADEMANELTLVRNKLRQTGITRELIEITSGAEASKSLL